LPSAGIRAHSRVTPTRHSPGTVFLRKVTLFGLAFVLIGGGAGAVFTDAVMAATTDNALSCVISDATSPGTTGIGTHTVTYAAPLITSSTGSSSFSFTVQNNGSIPETVSVTAGALGGPAATVAKFTAAAVTSAGSTTLAGTGDTVAYTAGLSWAGLVNGDTGATVSITYTVNCAEAGGPTLISTPTPTPTPTPPSLTLTWGDGTVRVAWPQCSGDGSNIRVVVRSLDASVSWPLLDANDTVVATLGPGDTSTTDAGAPLGTTVWYRVFCARADGDRYVVLEASAPQAITLPAAPTPTASPTPTPGAASVVPLCPGGNGWTWWFYWPIYVVILLIFAALYSLTLLTLLTLWRQRRWRQGL
jgi:hypothetical protein